MEYVTLNNGIKMPKLGYGVYQTPPEVRKQWGFNGFVVTDYASITEILQHGHVVFLKVAHHRL